MTNKTQSTEDFLQEVFEEAAVMERSKGLCPIDALRTATANLVFKNSLSKAQDHGLCIRCNKPAISFRDDLSRKDFRITQMCQECQDEIYKED